MKYGYIRVSTKEQNTDRQINGLLEKGILEENIFIDKLSGKDFDRAAYQKLKMKVTDGDIIYFHELDRFARNFDEGKQEVDHFQRQNVQLIFLDMEFLQAFQETEDVILRAMGYGQVLMYLAIAVIYHFIVTRNKEILANYRNKYIELSRQNVISFLHINRGEFFLCSSYGNL